MDKFPPALPVPEGVPNGQVAPFKVSEDHPVGPWSPDLVERLASDFELLGIDMGRSAGRSWAYEAAKALLRGQAVELPTSDILRAEWLAYRQQRTVLVPHPFLQIRSGPCAKIVVQ